MTHPGDARGQPPDDAGNEAGGEYAMQCLANVGGVGGAAAGAAYGCWRGPRAVDAVVGGALPPPFGTPEAAEEADHNHFPQGGSKKFKKSRKQRKFKNPKKSRKQKKSKKSKKSRKQKKSKKFKKSRK